MTSDELLRVARDRLYPSLRNPNYLVLRARRLIFRAWLESCGQDLMVLDVGGRYQPYRPLLQGKIRKYIALDLQPTAFVDVVGSGEEIPFRDARFDLVIATAVFEYFRQPHEAARNIHRVLKPGGMLLMSVASFAPRFVEEECWRYTPRGLGAVLSAFSQVTITPEVSSIGGVFRFANLCCHDFLKLKVLRAAHGMTLCPVLNAVGLGLESARLTSNDRWTGNYSVMAMR